MLHYNLAEKHNKLKADVISSILDFFRDDNFPKGKYILTDGDLSVIITEDGNSPLEYIEWDGFDLLFNSSDNHCISLFNLMFEDLLYFYEILEYLPSLETALEAYKD